MKKITLFFAALLLCSGLFAKTIYLNVNGQWNMDGYKIAVVEWTNWTFLDMTTLPGFPGYYQLDLPGGISNVQFYRFASSDVASWATAQYTDTWRTHDNVTAFGVNNCCTLTGPAQLNAVWSVFDPANVNAPTVSLTTPTQIALSNNITLSPSSTNVTDPIYTLEVMAPGSSTYTDVTSPYTPSAVGTYTFKASVAAGAALSVVLTSTTSSVLVFERLVIKTKVPASWGTVITINAWNGSGGGMYPTVKEGEWYTYTSDLFPPISFIVVNGADWGSEEAGWSKTSANTTNVGVSSCYEISETTMTDGKHEISAVGCGITSTVKLNEQSTVKMLVINRQLQLSFEGKRNVEIYNLNGQCLEKVNATDSYSKELKQGVYLVNVGDVYNKVIVN